MTNARTSWTAPPAGPLRLQDEVHVWRIALEVGSERLGRLEAHLSGAERDRASRFYFARHRRQFIVARGALRELLASYLNCEPMSLRFTSNRYGKPRLDGHSPLSFNVSHSGELALCALTAVGPVGVDLERERPMPNFERLAETFFAPEERSALDSQPARERAASFYTIWTRKEAVVKAHGRGLTIPLHAFAVSAMPGGPFELLRWEAEPRADSLALYDLPLGEGYAAALAVLGRASALRTWDWR